MRSLRKIMIFILLFVAVSGISKAEERVIYEIEQISDNKAYVTLDWYDQNTNKGLRIKGFELIDQETLVIYYDAGEQVSDLRSISVYVAETQFPLQIILSDGSDVEVFSDISTDDENYLSIMNMYYKGIIGGYPDGTYQPINNLTREQFAKMFVIATGLEIDYDTNSIFNDVSNSRWSKPYIMTLANKGIISGIGNNTYEPESTITIGEIAAIVDRTYLFYEKQSKAPMNTGTSHWSDDNLQALYEANIIKQGDTFFNQPTKSATREECAIILNRIILSLSEIIV